MALDGNRMGDAMMAAVDGVMALHPAGVAMTAAERRAIFRAMASAIITEFTTNGVVTIPFVTGVQPGTGTSGSGTGSIG
jgi:hypothetical protein